MSSGLRSRNSRLRNLYLLYVIFSPPPLPSPGVIVQRPLQRISNMKGFADPIFSMNKQSFIFSQIALTGFPLGLFIIMTITVVVFSLIGALLVGLLGALIFIVVVVGFALLILLPVLFVTTFAAAFIWLWGVGGYYILKWFNKKEIPGINAALPEGMSLEELAVKEEGGSEGQSTQTTTGEKQANYHANGDIKHAPSKGTSKTSSKEEDRDKKKNNVVGNTVTKVPGGTKVNDTTKGIGVDINGDPTKDPTKVVDVGKVTGKTGDVAGGGKLGDVGGKVTGRVGDVGKVKGVAGGLVG